MASSSRRQSLSLFLVSYFWESVAKVGFIANNTMSNIDYSKFDEIQEPLNDNREAEHRKLEVWTDRDPVEHSSERCGCSSRLQKSFKWQKKPNESRRCLLWPYPRLNRPCQTARAAGNEALAVDYETKEAQIRARLEVNQIFPAEHSAYDALHHPAYCTHALRSRSYSSHCPCTWHCILPTFFLLSKYVPPVQ